MPNKSPEIGAEKRGPGRPRLSNDDRSSVSSWIPTRHHDVLVRLANTGNVSVSQLIGQLVAREVQKTSK